MEEMIRREKPNLAIRFRSGRKKIVIERRKKL